MTREQIEKEAQRWAKGEITKSRIARAERAFIAGAEWRISSVWHDARKEVPEEFAPILVKRDDFTFSVNMVGGNMTSCPLHWVHWAYINDLLPEREEETE